MWLQDVQSQFSLVFEGRKVTSCLAMTEALKRGSSAHRQTPLTVEEFEVATGGGVWVAIGGHTEALNVSNGNAAALLALAGLPSAPYGEIPHERLESVIRMLIRVVNCESSRVQALTSVADGPRWSEGARTDESLKRRVAEMMALLVFARTNGCGVAWG